MALIDIASAERAIAAPPWAGTNVFLANTAFALTFASAASILFSIAASQILLGAAIVAAILSRQKVEFPAFFRPLLLFLAVTLVAVLASSDPHSGLPQIRKFYVFAVVPLVFTFFRTSPQIMALVITWTVIAFLSALLGLQQFLARLAEAHRLHWNTYEYVLDQRMTGFASHWMTFGGEQMIALLMLTSLLIFGPPSRWKAAGWIASIIIAASLVLGMTRSVYLAGFPAGLVWLLWKRKRVLVCVIPLLAIAAFASVPNHIRERVISVIRPHGNVDSNARRVIMARAGWAMIRSHPWLGIGPEQPGRQFAYYVPADVPRPLPKGWYGHLHDIYLQYAAERGVPALLILLFAISRAMADCIRAGRTADASHAWILHGVVAVVVSVLVEGVFEHNLGDSEVLTMFLIAIACGYAARRYAATAAPSISRCA